MEIVEAGERHSEDDYAIGQAVFALTRARAWAEAERVVDSCRGTPWWCQMLRGHVLAGSGALEEAESAFDAMVISMPEAVRCEWTDLSWVLPANAWNRFDSDDCLEEAAASETVWWLSDPSYLIPGNEAKVVHYNRIALATLHDDHILSARGIVTDGLGHAYEHHRVLLRRGMRRVEYDQAWAEPSRPFYNVIPSPSAMRDPLHSRSDAWDLDWGGNDVGTEVSFGELATIEPQVAFFQRGDSILATAAIDLPVGPVAGSPVREAALVLRSGPDSSLFASITNESRQRYVFSRMAPPGRYLVSVEAWSAQGIGRSRFGHGLERTSGSPVWLSDLLLYSASDPAGVDSLDDALVAMRGSHNWRLGDRVGLYLEVYGVEDPTGFDVTVSVAQVEAGGVLGGLRRLLGSGAAEPVEVAWRQQPSIGVASVGLTIPLRNLEPGEYQIEVEVETGFGSPVAAHRRIVVLRAR